MLGNWFFIVSGTISVMSPSLLLLWSMHSTQNKPPLFLSAVPIVGGLITILEGIGRLV